jgi:hypothetical protein
MAEETEIRLWKSKTFVSAVSMPKNEWLSQSIGFFRRKLIQKEKWRASGLMPGAISAKVAIVTQFPHQTLIVVNRRSVKHIRYTGCAAGFASECPRKPRHPAAGRQSTCVAAIPFQTGLQSCQGIQLPQVQASPSPPFGPAVLHALGELVQERTHLSSHLAV